MVSPLDSTWAANTHISMAHTIYGYVWPPSVTTGDTLSIQLCTVSPTVEIRFMKVGATNTYVFDATGANHVGVPAGVQLVSDDQGTNTGVWSTGCGWTPNLRVVVPPSWRSGEYYVEVWPQNGEPSYNRQWLPFVVRNTVPLAPILLIPSTSTDYAYQGWGGKSTYDKPYWDRTNVAALDRPADTNDGRGQFAQFDLGWVSFLDWAHVAVDMATMEDLQVRGVALLRGYREVIFSGHSEYWSDAQRAAVQAYVAGGGNVFFGTGNTCGMRSEYSANMRQFICYKGDNVTNADGGTRNIPPGQQYLYGPLGPHPLHPSTYDWRLPPASIGSYALTGLDWWDAISAATNIDGHGTPADWTVRDPRHWAFAGTGLARGARLGAQNLPGDEVDGFLLTWLGNPYDSTGVPLISPDAYSRGTPLSYAIAATAEANPFGVPHLSSPLWAIMGGFHEPGQGEVFAMPWRHLGADLWTVTAGVPQGNATIRQIVLNVIQHLLTVPGAGVGAPASEGVRLTARPVPDPARAGASGGGLQITLPRAARASLEVFTLDGERVQRLDLDLPAGESRLPWAFERARPAGVYFWRASAGGETVSGKVVFIP